MSLFTRYLLHCNNSATTIRPSTRPVWFRLLASEVQGDVTLRMTLADDFRDRGTLRIHVGKRVFATSIPYGGLFQPQAFSIPNGLLPAVVQTGIGISCPDATAPAIFLRGHPAHVPHLLAGPLPPAEADFWDSLASPASLQPFGWCEGCVLDALTDRMKRGQLARARVLERLALYFQPDGSLHYRDHLGRPSKNSLYGIEAALPFASLARVVPGHPALQRVVAFFMRRRDAQGCIRDPGKLTTEGMLVVAYVLACVGVALRRPSLLEEAHRQALFRIQHLSGAGWVAQRRVDGEGYACRNWSRGIAWYLLGLARLCPILKRAGLNTSELDDAFGRTCEWLAPLRHPDGYWYAFADDPASGMESSGTAGIAAAMALRGAGEVSSCVAWLRSRLAADGCLSAAAPLNKGGEAFQREGERVLAPFATGLAAQLFQAVQYPHAMRAEA